MVKDPVCGKTIDDEKIDGADTLATSGAPVTDPRFGTKRYHDGEWYYFCGMACRQRFIASPSRYLTADEDSK